MLGIDKVDVDAVARLMGAIKPLLAGHSPAMQGAVLADLLAIWLAGHHAGGETAAMRERLLAMHIGTVRALVAERGNHP
jgi:hypothetical protein